MREAVLARLRDAFRPEFLNRLDDIVVFHRLEKKHILGIVGLQLDAFAKRLADRRIGFEITDAAKSALADEGYDPVYGARPMKRVLQAKVETLVARKLIEGAVMPGDTLVVDAEDSDAGFVVSVQDGHRLNA